MVGKVVDSSDLTNKYLSGTKLTGVRRPRRFRLLAVLTY
jgi:hypothetical protein